MKVLHIISDADPRSGGPARALHGLCMAQLRSGMEVAVLATYHSDFDDSLLMDIATAGADVKYVGPVWRILNWHSDIAPSLRQKIVAADIVHIHAVWEYIQHAAARIARKLHRPYVIRPCGMLDPWCLNQSKYRKAIYMALRLRNNLNNATAIHCTTQTEAELITPLKLKSEFTVLPNGIDVNEFKMMPNASVFRSKYPVLGDRPILLFLSRLHYKKGLEVLIPAFADIADRMNFILVLAGPCEGLYQKKLEKLIQSHGVSGDVLFTGMLKGPSRIEAYAASDLFVLPSYQENFGISVVEAMAAGVPVIVSDQVNIHQQITDAGAGGVVPLQVAALLSELQKWMHYPQLRQEAGQRAREFVLSEFDWENIALRWKKEYGRLIAGYGE